MLVILGLGFLCFAVGAGVIILVTRTIGWWIEKLL
jgi:hypothetical protein